MKRNLLLLVMSVVMVFSCSMLVACDKIDIEAHRPKVTVTYVYEDGQTAAETYSEAYNQDTEYEITSPVIEGYTADLKVVKGKTAKANVDVTVTFVANKYTLAIVYTGAKNNPTSHFEDVSYKTDYSVTVPEVPGYTPDQTVISGNMDSLEGKTYTVKYTPNKYKLTINYTGTADAPEKYEAEVEYDSTFEVATPAIKGHTADLTTVNGTMDSVDGKTYTVKYVPNKYNLTVNYKYGENVFKTTQTEVEYGTSLTLEPEKFAFYKTTESSKNLTMDDHDEVVEFTYDFDSAPIANPAGLYVAGLPMFNQTTGFSIKFNFSGTMVSDWVRIISGHNILSAADVNNEDIFKIYNGCIDSYLEYGKEDSYTGNFCDGAQGHPTDYGMAWDALVPYGNTIEVVMSFQPDGTIRMYRDGKCVLRFDANTASGNNNFANKDNTYTVSMFTQKVIEYIATYGFQIAEMPAGMTISNFSVGPAAEYSTVTVEFKSEGGKTLANPVVFKEYIKGAAYSCNAPEVVAYEVHADQATVSGTVAAENETITVLYKKVSNIVTVNAYADTLLIGTKQLAVQPNASYTVEVPQFAFYKTTDVAKVLQLAEEDVEVEFRGYSLDTTQTIAKPNGQKFGPFPMVTNNTGFEVSFDLTKVYGDWVQLFHSTNTLIFDGCVRYMPDGKPWSDWYDGDYGYGASYKNQFGTAGWDNVVPRDNSIRITVAFRPDGSLYFYRDGKLALTFFATVRNKDSNVNEISDLVYAFINDVATDGFYINQNFFDNMNEGGEFTQISNLSVNFHPATEYDKNTTLELPAYYENLGGGWNGDNVHVIQTLTGDFDAVLEYSQNTGDACWQTPLLVIRDANEYGNVAVMRQDWWGWIDSTTGTLGTGDVNGANINRFDNPLLPNGALDFNTQFLKLIKKANVKIELSRRGKVLTIVMKLTGAEGDMNGKSVYVSYCMNNISVDTIEVALSMEFANATVTGFAYAQ